MKRVLVYIAAAVVPFSVVWSIMSLLAREPPARPTENAKHLFRYFAPLTRTATNTVRPSTVWEDDVAPPKPYTAMAVVRGSAVLLNDVAVTTIDLDRARPPEVQATSSMPALRRPHEVAPSADDETLWTLTSTLLIGLRRGANGVTDVAETFEMPGFATCLHWLGRDELIVNGPFQDGLLRRYRRAKAAVGDGDVIVRAGSGSDRLFPGLALRANIAETILLAGFSERGEKKEVVSVKWWKSLNATSGA